MEPKPRRFVVGHSSQLAQQQVKAFTTAPGKEAGAVADYSGRVAARSFACLADAEAAIAQAEGPGQGQRGRKPTRWHSHTLHYRVETFTQRQKRSRRGRPTKTDLPQEETRYCLVVAAQALAPAEAEQGWTV